jgi:hypothetical protein
LQAAAYGRRRAAAEETGNEFAANSLNTDARSAGVKAARTFPTNIHLCNSPRGSHRSSAVLSLTADHKIAPLMEPHFLASARAVSRLVEAGVAEYPREFAKGVVDDVEGIRQQCLLGEHSAPKNSQPK